MVPKASTSQCNANDKNGESVESSGMDVLSEIDGALATEGFSLYITKLKLYFTLQKLVLATIL